MLKLSEVMKIPQIDRNKAVLDINFKEIPDGSGDKFMDAHGALCGCDDSGLVAEDSCDTLLRESGININFETKEYAILSQDDIEYRVPITIDKGGCSVPTEHFNFTQMELYKNI